MNPLTLIIDQGTHATRALAFDADGQALAATHCPVSLQRLSADRVEQDAAEIAASLHQTLTGILADDRVRQAGIAQAGLATQRSSVVAWDRETGEPLTPVINWQDRRAAAWLAQFAGNEPVIKEKTGLPLSPHYGASKLRWLLDHVPAVQQARRDGRLAFGPLASFLLARLLRGQPFLVDHANANRTQLWHIDYRDWDPWLLDLFGVPGDLLPVCRPIVYEYGLMSLADAPVTAVNGDQNAVVYALGQPEKGTAVINLGTGAFVLISTGRQRVSHPALLTGLTSSTAFVGEYTLEGTVNGAGSALSWAGKRWGIPDIPAYLDEWLARPEEPPVFLNSIGGLGSPFWRPGPEPVIVGEGDLGQRVTAVAESILFLLQINLDEMRAAGATVSRLRVSGGLAQSGQLCQRLADLSGCPVYRPQITEATARGTAWLAAGRPSHWPELQPGKQFDPRPNTALTDRYWRFRELMAL
ncbi:MAG TPA: hypothetical protein ENK32_05280 [Anaerolineae bacterium]|nr:hypothetical protein [Anaerolineae bacterium]